MDSIRPKKIIAVGMLVIITFSLFFIPSVNGENAGVFDQKMSPTGTGNYVEDFSTTTYFDGTSTAEGWGNGAVTKDRNFSLSMLDFFPTLDPVRGVAVQGRKAYFGEFNATHTDDNFQIINIENLQDIKYVGSRTGTAQKIHTMQVDGDLAYMGIEGSMQGRINVYNVSDAFNIGTGAYYLDSAYCSGEVVTDISVQGHLMYYTGFNATDNRSFNIADIEDPDSIDDLITTHWDCNMSLGLDVAGQLAYIAASTEGLYILNVSDKFSPVEVGHVDTPGNATDVLVEGGYAYVADGNAGIQVVDIRDATNPTIVGSYDTPGNTRRLKLQGRTLFVADGTGGVQVLDVADKTHPCFVTEILSLPYTWDLDLYGGDLVVATDEGIHTIRLCAGDGIGSIAEDVYANTFDTYNASDIRVIGDIAYVAGGENGLYTLNVQDPANPILLDQIDVLGFARKLDVKGQFAYVVDYGYAFRVFDISDPTNIFETDSIGLTYPTDVAVAGDIAWIADGAYGVYYYNISDPYTITYISHFDDGFENVTAIWVQGPHLYFTEYIDSGTSSCVHVYDIRDFSDPKSTYSRTRFDYNYDIQVDGDLLYLAGTDDGNGLWIYNTSDPFTMSIEDSVNRDTHGVWSFGSYVLTADNGDGVALINASTPNLAYAHSIYPNATAAIQITTHGDYTYIANTTNLIILRHFKSAGDTYRTSVSIAQSLEVDNTEDVIYRATLGADVYIPTGTGINYFMSADGGANWEAVTLGVEHVFTSPGNDLRWRAEITGPEDRSAHLYEITIDYFFNEQPTTPQIIEPGTLSVVANVMITWNASTDDVGIDLYELQVDTENTFANPTTYNATTNEYLIENMANGVYYFRVRAIDDYDYASDWSATVDLEIDVPLVNLPWWAYVAAGGGLLLIILIVVISVVVSKKKKAGGTR